MNRLTAIKHTTSLALATLALSLFWVAVPAHADDGCPWRVVPSGGSLWQQAPWWPYLVGALCVLGGLALVILLLRRRKKDEEQQDGDKAAEPEPETAS